VQVQRHIYSAKLTDSHAVYTRLNDQIFETLLNPTPWKCSRLLATMLLLRTGNHM